MRATAMVARRSNAAAQSLRWRAKKPVQAVGERLPVPLVDGRRPAGTPPSGLSRYSATIRRFPRSITSLHCVATNGVILACPAAGN
jgi:hypothetical protein